jgi:hypothetical protein
MLNTREKLHLIAIEEEIAHLQLQMCMEECAYLGAKTPAEKDTEAEASERGTYQWHPHLMRRRTHQQLVGNEAAQLAGRNASRIH